MKKLYFVVALLLGCAAQSTNPNVWLQLDPDQIVVRSGESFSSATSNFSGKIAQSSFWNRSNEKKTLAFSVDGKAVLDPDDCLFVRAEIVPDHAHAPQIFAELWQSLDVPLSAPLAIPQQGVSIQLEKNAGEKIIVGKELRFRIYNDGVLLPSPVKIWTAQDGAVALIPEPSGIFRFTPASQGTHLIVLHYKRFSSTLSFTAITSDHPR